MSDEIDTNSEIIAYATKARKNGIVALEEEADAVPDRFLRKALNLAVDGTDLQELRKMMEIDMTLAEHASALAALLQNSCYVDEGAIREAIARHASFNAIHHDTGLKIDVFPFP